MAWQAQTMLAEAEGRAAVGRGKVAEQEGLDDDECAAEVLMLSCWLLIVCLQYCPSCDAPCEDPGN